MKKWQINLLESFIDDFDLTDIEQDQVRELIAKWHCLENTNKSACRKVSILQKDYPEVYNEVMEKYTEKYGRFYGGETGIIE